MTMIIAVQIHLAACQVLRAKEYHVLPMRTHSFLLLDLHVTVKLMLFFTMKKLLTNQSLAERSAFFLVHGMFQRVFATQPTVNYT
jgi:hypothetical protein